jgi:hypothetical protein
MRLVMTDAPRLRLLRGVDSGPGSGVRRRPDLASLRFGVSARLGELADLERATAHCRIDDIGAVTRRQTRAGIEVQSSNRGDHHLTAAEQIESGVAL